MEINLSVQRVALANAAGLYTQAVETAVRAGVSRVIESSFMDLHDDPVYLAPLPEDVLPPLSGSLPAARAKALNVRTTRMLKIAGLALATLVGDLRLATPPPLLLAAPRDPRLPRDLLGLLAVQSGVELDWSRSRLEPGGRATALTLLQLADALISQGRAQAVIVGGVDSGIDLKTLAERSLAHRLHTLEHSDGYSSGEGAGFLLVSRGRLAEVERGCGARISRLGLGLEPGTRESEAPYLGEGLAEAMGQVSEGLGERVSTVFTSFNGEHYWTREFGVAILRNRHALTEDVRFMHPAMSYGDLGAAAGISALGLAIEGLRRRRFAGPLVVYASSDDGVRAVVVAGKE
ncbi:hypothetical protein G6O69_33820 [Pseudenhygromyxa sp. WMMC2535]|uniref:beta-ketoacyl synthase N-terminal-like domain-containing protein n=1 Tax=Pseudenhygromyxa sp. WMMC2535 TaxID=2712867 RepID=UPI001557D87F|nr:beta-ketoacyl synthase N-terminal-like domain-containing protein [Pseudenhygromyxa sp. WMMC2535]NVB42848.1 hypothetical protein [Pseudenhygromyxa sp. WMMC2535]